MKEKTYFRSAPFFLLKGTNTDEPIRFGFFSNRTLLKPSLEIRETNKESFKDIISASDAHEISYKIAESLQSVSSLLIRLAAVFRKTLIFTQEGDYSFLQFFEMRKNIPPFSTRSQEETFLSHVLSHYPKREFDLKKIVDALPEPFHDEIPATLLVSCAIGALSQKGLDEGEFFIEINQVTSLKNHIKPFLVTLDETKQEMIKEFVSEGKEPIVINDKMWPLDDLVVRQKCGRTSLISKKFGQEVIFEKISGDLSKEYQLLLSLSQASSIDPSLFFKSPFFQGAYVPRLRYDRVILSAARWTFDVTHIDENNIKKSIEDILENYELDDVCFVLDGEFLNLVCVREEIDYLSDVFKRVKSLCFIERLFTEKTVLVKGNNTVFTSEVFVPFLKDQAIFINEEGVTRLHA